MAATSVRASVAPSPPTHLAVQWTAPGQPGDALAATWTAGATGNSPIDKFQVTVTAYDPGGPAPGPFTQNVPASTLTANFVIDDTFNWSPGSGLTTRPGGGGGRGR